MAAARISSMMLCGAQSVPDLFVGEDRDVELVKHGVAQLVQQNMKGHVAGKAADRFSGVNR